MDNDSGKAERENAHLQAQFEQIMMDTTPGHRHVAVLALSWEAEETDDLDTSEEVDTICRVFKEKYGFQVHRETLKMSENKAKTHINYIMAKFIHEEDRDDTLLIIYYAGHGSASATSPNGLSLAGGNARRVAEVGQEIVWDNVEGLIEGTKADILLILDCCHAAKAGHRKRRATFSRRSYEVLGACQHNELAYGPGPDSFTSALIWALEELVSPPKSFTTSQLYGKILNAPVYESLNSMEPHNTPHPYWSEKAGYHTFRKLIITPRSAFDDIEPEPSNVETKHVLTISFLLSEQLNGTDIKNIGGKMKEVMRPGPEEPNSKIHQVLWRGLTPKPELSDVAELVALKLRKNQVRKQLDMLKSLGPTPTLRIAAQQPVLPLANGELESPEGIALQDNQQLFLSTINPNSGVGVRQDQLAMLPIIEKGKWAISGAIMIVGLRFLWKRLE